VALRWLVQQGVIPLPRSSNPAHAAENLDLFGFRLSDEEMMRVRGLKEPGGRIIDPDANAPEWD
jgi:diketogulonate reductase-like aldo/keto reductase